MTNLTEGAPKTNRNESANGRWPKLGLGLAVVAAIALASFLAIGQRSMWAPGRAPPTANSQDAVPSTAANDDGGSRWGAGYFPNVPLTTHEGKPVRFFDDLIDGKIVVINFIFTSCQNSCPLETARLAKVQQILGDRVGRDVFMYSVSIDPENDTPEVLNKYAKKYKVGPGWWFLTGKEEHITLLQKKLGLFIEEIQGPDNDHNLSLMIGNQRTGRWMKRSPFENPYYLATQIGSWLHNWQVPDRYKNDYAEAPELRELPLGENLFRSRCVTCHTIGEGELPQEEMGPKPGPDLLGVTARRERPWLARWLREPDVMLKEKDPIAVELYEAYDEVLMPNFQLNKKEIDALIEYMHDESRRVVKARALASPDAPTAASAAQTASAAEPD